MEPCVFDCTERLVAAFHQFAETGQIINLQFWFQCYAFDLIGLITVWILILSSCQLVHRRVIDRDVSDDDFICIAKQAIRLSGPWRGPPRPSSGVAQLSDLLRQCGYLRGMASDSVADRYQVTGGRHAIFDGLYTRADPGSPTTAADEWRDG
jgi:hypothetical protein